MKISFLLQNAYGIGGTICSTFNVAGALAERHDVEIVSIIRSRRTPRLTLDRKVKLVHLIDTRAEVGTDRDNELLQQGSALIPPVEATGAEFSALTDKRVAEHLARTDADVVVATRPGLVIYLAEFGQDRYLRIGQEHRIYGTHEPNIRAAQDRAIPRLDAHTAVSKADAATHRERFPAVKTKLIALPNGVPPSEVEPSDGNAKLVVAAGRLIPVKRYDLLIAAWAIVAAARPDWKLRIYGRGPENAKLRAQIDRLGLNECITLMGAYCPIETEWVKGSIAAVTSSEESFGMAIVEAMNCGVPVVATDCPHGPGEIINDGKDGLLVPVGDRGGIAKGLLKLIEDNELRHVMGKAARISAARYSSDASARAFEHLIASLGGDIGSDTAASKPAHMSVLCTASCGVNADGNIIVSIDSKSLSGDKLSLMLTRSKQKDQPISVPLQAPTTATGSWTAVLNRRELRLGEGRWELHVLGGDGGARRLVSHLADGRGLVDLKPLSGSPFIWWIPYPTVDGHLALRVWLRTGHAEARVVRQSDTKLTIEGTLHGAEFGSDSNPVLIGTLRMKATEKVRADVTVIGKTNFTVTLPYAQLRAVCDDNESNVWDLAMHLAPDAEPARIARIIGDIVDRGKTDLYPTVGGVHPYFTVNSNLAIDCPAHEGA